MKNATRTPLLITSNSMELKPAAKAKPAADDTKTLATRVYGDLLATPFPKTQKDFQRILIMAVMVGRQIEHDFTTPVESTAPTGDGWQTTPPNAAGVWEMRCNESDFKSLLMTIEDRDGELWALDDLIGPYPLDLFHAGLIELRWRKPLPISNTQKNSSSKDTTQKT
jgi:hypothetical protein